MSKHAPGPWIAYEIAPDDPEWGACEIWPAENDRENEEGTVKPVATMVMGVDNARLIAAAPELLAELEMLSNIVEGCGMATMPEVECRLVFARAAIAKATGGAQ
ncbi:hypothetical protein [Stenotrophomonas maltophilia]|uniref:hypothetical protein n=1 Tax=Stenotrophomonas maltophilia TaxID=40324 RepID=UPI0013D9DB94|nr:hypothetical protein [Stenotrophomonas maltophilia]